MKVLITISTVVILLLLALAVVRKRAQDVVVYGLSWSDLHEKASFEFIVKNRTDEAVDVTVTVIAERRLESRTGPEVSEAGRSRLVFHLGPKEEKKQVGEIPLASALKVRWTPKIGQEGSLSPNPRENDPHVQETTSA